MNIRVLETMEEFEQAVQIELAVWGAGERDALPTHIMRANSLLGGATWGAFDETRMVGIAFAVPGVRDGNPILWSHITGVLPEYQRHNIGYELKLSQKAWALAHNIHEIRWTFDPLQAGNAFFNLHRLGVTCRIYHVDFYGVMTDSINAGIPSDRLEAVWNLDTPPLSRAYVNLPYALKNESGTPVKQDAASAEQCLVEIPNKLRELDLDTRLVWRTALRDVLVSYFAQGYTAVDFQRDESGQPAYLLARS